MRWVGHLGLALLVVVIFYGSILTLVPSMLGRTAAAPPPRCEGWVGLAEQELARTEVDIRWAAYRVSRAAVYAQLALACKIEAR